MEEGRSVSGQPERLATLVSPGFRGAEARARGGVPPGQGTARVEPELFLVAGDRRSLAVSISHRMSSRCGVVGRGCCSVLAPHAAVRRV